ncbi:MAG: glutathione peroxidase [Phycisphaerales bacterium]|nr:glutathione peroxidase [Phycisphaerales bacterium]
MKVTPWMRLLLKIWPLSLVLAGCDNRVVESESSMNTAFHQHATNDLQGTPVDLGQYEGSVVLVVNVASHCGYTSQYEGLEELHKQYKDRGFTVMAFPCNDFGGQEPGGPEEIAQTCRTTFGATFPVMEKVVVVDDAGQSPIYAEMGRATGELPKWNFGKYLVDGDGNTVAFFGSSVKPMSPEITGRIESLLPPASKDAGS